MNWICLLACFLRFLLGCLLAACLGGCDDSEANLSLNLTVPSPSPEAGSGNQPNPGAGPTIGSGSAAGGDLRVLGSDADANQQAFRARFGLGTPTAEELAGMTPYQARLTVYSDVDSDWPSPTVAMRNWRGTTDADGNPVGVDGTTAAVDFNRVPPHSLLYIPATDQYVEAIDTGATRSWAATDAGKSDYGSGSLGRIDLRSSAQGRSSQQVESQFANWIGSSEYGQVYVVYAGGGWKQGH
ncbi:MAG TPA: hypothetical protein VGD78_04375 [Chthoniobacterales bacterium]